MSRKACNFVDKINKRGNKTKNLGLTVLVFGEAILTTLLPKFEKS